MKMMALALGLAVTVSGQAASVDVKLPAYKKVSGVSGTLNSVGSDTLNNMLSQSLSAFVSGNTQSAKAVIKQDKKVDALNKEVRSVSVQAITENKLTADSGLNHIAVSYTHLTLPTNREV